MTRFPCPCSTRDTPDVPLNTPALFLEGSPVLIPPCRIHDCACLRGDGATRGDLSRAVQHDQCSMISAAWWPLGNADTSPWRCLPPLVPLTAFRATHRSASPWVPGALVQGRPCGGGAHGGPHVSPPEQARDSGLDPSKHCLGGAPGGRVLRAKASPSIVAHLTMLRARVKSCRL